MKSIIELAREAGMAWQGGFTRVVECVTQSELERFAALVRAAALAEQQEPVAWRDPTNSDPGQGCTYDKAVHEKWPHIYKQPLYTAPQPAKREPLTQQDALEVAAAIRALKEKA